MQGFILLWQRLHYSVYRFSLFVNDKIIGWPFSKFFENKWVLKQYRKRGVNDPYKLIRWATTRPHFGVVNWSTDGLMILLTSVLAFSVINFLSYFSGKMIVLNKLMFVLVLSIPSILINYFVLWKGDKYLIYFKTFDKEPKEIKRKWAWRSLGVVIVIIGILILSFYFMTSNVVMQNKHFRQKNSQEKKIFETLNKVEDSLYQGMHQDSIDQNLELQLEKIEDSLYKGMEK